MNESICQYIENLLYTIETWPKVKKNTYTDPDNWKIIVAVYSLDVKEVIYSQSEPCLEEPYANSSWNSNDNFTSGNEPTRL